MKRDSKHTIVILTIVLIGTIGIVAACSSSQSSQRLSPQTIALTAIEPSVIRPSTTPQLTASPSPSTNLTSVGMNKLDPKLRMLVEGTLHPDITVDEINGIKTVRVTMKTKNGAGSWLTEMPGVQVHSAIDLKSRWLLTANIPVDKILEIAQNDEVLEITGSYPVAPNTTSNKP